MVKLNLDTVSTADGDELEQPQELKQPKQAKPKKTKAKKQKPSKVRTVTAVQNWSKKV